MNHDLVVAGLVTQKAIHVNTELQILVNRQTFQVLVQTITLDPLQFYCASVIDGSTVNVLPKDVCRIDGMIVARIAELYCVETNGDIAPAKRKRKKSVSKIIPEVTPTPKPKPDIILTLPSGFTIAESERSALLAKYPGK